MALTSVPLAQLNVIDAVAVVLAVAHEVGVQRLKLRQAPARQRATRRRSWLFYGALALLVAVSSGPLERWSMDYLSAHMALHLLEMIYLPAMLVASGPGVPLRFALPVGPRRALLRRYHRSAAAAPLRGAVAVLCNRWVGLVAFNAAMLFWHVPGVFNWAMAHPASHAWAMTPSFVVAGILFFRLLLPSYPKAPAAGPGFQVFAIVVTMAEMLLLAMAMAVFAKAPWYEMYVAAWGPTAAMQDQHIAAGILWICGDLWAIPALAMIAYRLVKEGGSVSARFEHALGRA